MKFDLIVLKIMQILDFLCENYEIHENHEVLCDNDENHATIYNSMRES